MPSAPGVQFDPSIITGSGRNIAAAITGMGDEWKQIKKQDKAAKAIYDALEPEADGQTGALKAHPLGLTKDAFNSLSSSDRIAKISGFVEAEAIKSGRAKEARARLEQAMQERELGMRREELDLRKGESAARLDAATREAGAESALGKVFADAGTQTATMPGSITEAMAPGMGAFPSIRTPAQGKVTPDALLAALSKNPQAVNSRNFSTVDNLLRAMQTQRDPKGLSFMTSPTGATIALSPDTGAFQYDPFSKAQAMNTALAPRDALKAYNDNQERLSKLQRQRKLADNPDMKDLFDASALDAEIEQLKGEQSQLGPQAGLKKGVVSPATGKPAASQFKKGDRAKQNGKTYEFDGQQWNEVK